METRSRSRARRWLQKLKTSPEVELMETLCLLRQTLGGRLKTSPEVELMETSRARRWLQKTSLLKTSPEVELMETRSQQKYKAQLI